MQKRMFHIGVVTLLLPISAIALPRPIATVSLGFARANVFATKTITILPPFTNFYVSSNHYDKEPVIGLFLGGEILFLRHWLGQLGVSYYQSDSFKAKGAIYQFSDPSFNNLRYEYQIRSKRFYLESKVARMIKQKWQVYLNAGLGSAFNEAYGYTETPTNSAGVAMAQPFARHKTTAFTYLAGVGIDLEVTSQLRAGIGYRFVDLGNASLGTTPLQSSRNTISNNHIRSNEIFAQFSYTR